MVTGKLHPCFYLDPWDFSCFLLNWGVRGWLGTSQPSHLQINLQQKFVGKRKDISETNEQLFLEFLPHSNLFPLKLYVITSLFCFNLQYGEWYCLLFYHLCFVEVHMKHKCSVMSLWFLDSMEPQISGNHGLSV